MSFKFCPSEPDKCQGCEYDDEAAIKAYEAGDMEDMDDVYELLDWLLHQRAHMRLFPKHRSPPTHG